MRNGRRREMGLGSFENGTAPVPLRLARQKADEVRAILAEGGDPFRDLRPRRDDRTITFGDAADRFITAMRPTWQSEKTTAQTIMTLEVYAKPLRSLPVDTIETTDVLRTLKPIWDRIPETARRTRNRIERVLDYATAHGWRTGDNPARWVGNLKHLLPEQDRGKRGHHAAMPIDDCARFTPEAAIGDRLRRARARNDDPNRWANVGKRSTRRGMSSTSRRPCGRYRPPA